jgi:hypothetical protein
VIGAVNYRLSDRSFSTANICRQLANVTCRYNRKSSKRHRGGYNQPIARADVRQ